MDHRWAVRERGQPGATENPAWREQGLKERCCPLHWSKPSSPLIGPQQPSPFKIPLAQAKNLGRISSASLGMGQGVSVFGSSPGSCGQPRLQSTTLYHVVPGHLSFTLNPTWPASVPLYLLFLLLEQFSCIPSHGRFFQVSTQMIP